MGWNAQYVFAQLKHFFKQSAYSLSCPFLNEKIDTTFIYA